MKVRQPCTFRMELVHVWCLEDGISMTGHIAVSLIIRDDEDDVWLIRGSGNRTGHTQETHAHHQGVENKARDGVQAGMDAAIEGASARQKAHTGVLSQSHTPFLPRLPHRNRPCVHTIRAYNACRFGEPGSWSVVFYLRTHVAYSSSCGSERSSLSVKNTAVLEI